MSIKGDTELTAACFKYWPTGRECVTFYFIMFMTVCVVAVCVVMLATQELSCSTQSTFQSLLMTCVAYWLKSPMDYYK